MDNAKFHKSKETVENSTSSKNKILNILPYNAQMKPIENLYSQLKNHVRNKSSDNFEELKQTIDRIILKS
jgi:transposase